MEGGAPVWFWSPLPLSSALGSDSQCVDVAMGPHVVLWDAVTELASPDACGKDGHVLALASLSAGRVEKVAGLHGFQAPAGQKEEVLQHEDGERLLVAHQQEAAQGQQRRIQESGGQ